MSIPQPFSLRIFVADGDPDGLRLVERSNWIGKALVFPRKLYPEVRNRSEFQQTGVYLLLDGEGETIYIGEFTPGPGRPVEFLEGPECFNRVVFFTACGGQLNQAHAQFLASHLVGLAKKAKKVKLKDCADVPEPMLSVADQADMEAFLDNMLVVLPPAGVGLFEEGRAKAAETRASVGPVADAQSASDAAKKREEQEQAAKMEKFIRSLLKPSKRNLSVATCLGIVLVLIQCARAGYLPDFDWKSGAGAVALVAVLAVSLFVMVFLTLCVALPSLPVAREPKPVINRYLGAVILAPLWIAGLVAIGTLGRKWGWVESVCGGTWGPVRILALLLVPLVLLAFGAGWGFSGRNSEATIKKRLALGATMLQGIGMVPLAYFSLYGVLARYSDDDIGSRLYFIVLPALVVMLVNVVVLLRPNRPMVYASIAAGVFGLLCIPASSGSFTLLGLGGRTVEFYLEKPEFAADLARGSMVPSPADTHGKLYEVYLRLRLGPEIAVSANDEKWGPAADVVAIPRNAIRGLRFVPPPTKNGSKPAAEEARNPQHLIAASKQWALQRAAEQFLAGRAERWKAAQKNELSPAQVEWLKWARETTTQVAPFADGYPVLPDAKQAVPQSTGTAESAKPRGDPDAAFSKP